MKKRILSMILTLAIGLSLLPTAAFAAGTRAAPEAQYVPVVKTTGGYELIDGPPEVVIPETGSNSITVAVCATAPNAAGQPDLATCVPMTASWAVPSGLTYVIENDACVITVPSSAPDGRTTVTASMPALDSTSALMEFPIELMLTRSGGALTEPQLSPVNEPEQPGYQITNLVMTGGYWANMSMTAAWDTGKSRMDGWSFKVGVPGVFYVEPNGPTKHEITLFSNEDMVPEGLTVEGGTLIGAFERIQLGSHDPNYQPPQQGDPQQGGDGGNPGREIYLFRGTVEFPNDTQQLTFKYQGGPICLVALGTVRFPAKPYAAYAELREKRSDGTYLMRISGVNLPETASAYEVGDLPVGEQAKTVWLQGTTLTKNRELNCLDVVLAPTGVEIPHMRGWHRLLVNDAELFYGAANDSACFATLKALEGDGSSTGSVIAPPAVSMANAVTSPTVTVTLQPGGYTRMRWKLDAGAFSPWTVIPVNLTISLEGQFGNHTVYFEFDDAAGHTTQISRSVLYQNSSIKPAPEVVGLADDSRKLLTAEADGSYQIYDNLGAGYLVFAEYEENQSLEAVAKKADGTEIIYDMLWNSDARRYETVAVSLSEFSSVGIRAKQGIHDLGPGEAKTLSLVTLSAPVVYGGNTPWIMRDYVHSDGRDYYSVRPGETMFCTFTGTHGDGITGYVRLDYEDNVNGARKQQRFPCTFESADTYSGRYVGRFAIPDDAAVLNEVTYLVCDTNDQCGSPRTFQLRRHVVASPLSALLAPEYAGTSLRIYAKNSDGSLRYNRSEYLRTAAAPVSFGIVNAGDYFYELSGESGFSAKGSFTVTEGRPFQLDLSNLPQLGELTIQDTSAEVWELWDITLRISWTGSEGQQITTCRSFYGGNVKLPHLPTGTQLTITPEINGTKIKGLADGQKSVTHTVAGSDTLSLNFEYFPRHTLTGQVKNSYGYPLLFTGVAMVQKVTLNDGTEHVVTDFCPTDETGSFRFEEVYSDFPLELYTEARNYVSAAVPLSSGESRHDIIMEFKESEYVLPKLWLKPVLDEQGKPLNGSMEPVQGSTDWLKIKSIVSENGVEIPFTREVTGDGNIRFYLKDSGLHPGTQLTIQLEQLAEDTRYFLSETTLTGTLNQNSNLELNMTATPRSRICAVVTDEQDGADTTGVLLVYEGEKVIRKVIGKGTLTAESLDAGVYTVAAFKVAADQMGDFTNIINSCPGMILAFGSYNPSEVSIREQHVATGVSISMDLRTRALMNQEQLGLKSDVAVYIYGEPDPVRKNLLKVTVNAIGNKSQGFNNFIGIYLPVNRSISEAYVNGERTDSNLKTINNTNTHEMNVCFWMDLDPTTMMAKGTVELRYETSHGYANTHREISLYPPDLEIFQLEAPETAWLGDRDQISVKILATPSDIPGENLVTLYDNGVAAGTVELNPKTGEAVSPLPLSRPQESMIHEITASRSLKGERKETSTQVAVTGRNQIITTHIIWNHRNDKGQQRWGPFDTFEDMMSRTYRYYPAMRSDISFRILNASAAELDDVRLVLYHNGIGELSPAQEFPAEKIGEGTMELGGSHHRYVEYQVSTRLGYSFAGMGVKYALKTDLSGCTTEHEKELATLDLVHRLYGGETQDLNADMRDMQNLTPEQQARVDEDAKSMLPSELRDSTMSAEVSPDGSVKVNVTPVSRAESSMTDVDMSLSLAENSMTEAQIKALMEQERGAKYDENGNLRPGAPDVSWSSYITQQGRVYLRQEVTETQNADGTVSRQTQTKTFMPQAVVDAVDDGASTVQTFALRAAPRSADGSNYAVGDAISNTTAAADIYSDLSSKFMEGGSGKIVGRSVAVMDVLKTVDKILGGPGGKDPALLWELVKKVEDSGERMSLVQEILDYEEVRADGYMNDSLARSVMAGLGCGNLNLAAKVGTFLGGITYDMIQGEAEHYMNQMFDSIVTSIIVVLEKEAKKQEAEDKSPIKLYIDPSGYVFEGTQSQRVGGVTATILQGDGSTTETSSFYTPWFDDNPVVEERQDNPMTTSAESGNAMGRYGWMTPVGAWKVRFEKDGYQTAESKAMNVPPEHTQVNIGLLSTKVPQATGVNIYQNAVTVDFDLWMQLEALADVTGRTGTPEDNSDCYPLAGSVFLLLDGDKNPVPGHLTFPDKVPNTGYKENSYQQDVITSDWFVRQLCFVPDRTLTAGQSYTVVVAKNALSYAGVSMTAEKVFTSAAASEQLPESCTITLDANGGSVSPQVLHTNRAGQLASLPIPERAGWSFTGWLAADGTVVTTSTIFRTDTTITAQWKTEDEATPPTPPTPDDSGSSGGGGSGGSSHTTTNPDGSKTTTRVRADGTKVETTAYPNGDKLVVETRKDGSTTEKATRADGTTAVTQADAEGNTVTELRISKKAAQEAEKAGKPVEPLMSPLRVGKGPNQAPLITVSTSVRKPVDLLIPVEPVDSGLVAVLVDDKGTETVIPRTAMTERGIVLTAEFSTTVKLVRNAGQFDDASGHWAVTFIDFVTARRLFGGVGDNRFSPNTPMTRGMLTRVLHNLECNPEQVFTGRFEDVADGQWYSESISWACEHGIVGGYGNGSFGPHDAITREQLAVMLWRYTGSPAVTNDVMNFPDSDSVSAWARPAMLWAIDNGVINGMGGMLNPQGTATRAQTAAMITRFINLRYRSIA